MTRRPFEAPDGARRARPPKAATILLALCAALGAGASWARQTSPRGAEGGRDAEVAGVKFDAPRDFRLQHTPDPNLAFMSHTADEVALFVAVPGGRVDEAYLSGLAESLTRRLLPQESGFEWKTSEQVSERKVSAHQTGGGTVKGLNAKKFVQVDYVVLKAQGRLVMVGSVATFGEEREAKFLFGVNGREYSVVGWEGLLHLIASVTGERPEGGR